MSRFAVRARPTPPITVTPSATASGLPVFAKLLILQIILSALALVALNLPGWIEGSVLPITEQQWLRPYLSVGARWAGKALTVLVVLMVLSIVGTVMQVLRRRQLERLTAAVVRELGNRTTSNTPVRIRRNFFGRPRRVDVYLPADFVTEEVKNRVSLEKIVARVLGRFWKGDWREERLRRGRLTLRPKPSPEADKETDMTRVLAIARKIFGPTANLVASSTALGEDGRLEKLTLRFPPHQNLANALFRERVAGALTEILPGTWEVIWDLQSDLMHGIRRAELAATIPYVPAPITDKNRWKIPVAQAAGQAEPASWNLEGKTPHGLVTGETGGGKTYAFLNLALEVLRRGIPVIGVDPKQIELMALERWPGFEQLATTPKQIADAIDYLHDLMMYRYRLIRQRLITRNDLWPVVAFLDELLILQAELNDYWAQLKVEEGIKGGREHPSIRKIVRLAALARSARIHLIVGVQRGQATLFDDGARDNFRFRLSLGQLSQQGAIQMWGDPTTGTKVPANIPGRGTISSPSGPVEAQVFKLPELDLEIPDEELPPADAELRRRLVAECAQAVKTIRPAEPVLKIDGFKPDVGLTIPDLKKDSVDIPADDRPAMVPAKGLQSGDRVLMEDPDDSSQMVEVTLDEVSDELDRRITLDFRTDDGLPGQVELNGDDELALL